MPCLLLLPLSVCVCCMKEEKGKGSRILVCFMFLYDKDRERVQWRTVTHTVPLSCTSFLKQIQTPVLFVLFLLFCFTPFFLSFSQCPVVENG